MDSQMKAEKSKKYKYTTKEFFESLYWEIGDDGEQDGYLHIVSTLDGREVKIALKRLQVKPWWQFWK